ncbi:MAG: hypothetical protein KKF44_07560 [Nanoarchaeota archaeon]|nr:hypothetical protein [Nanoarchaeota archaeon]
MKLTSKAGKDLPIYLFLAFCTFAIVLPKGFIVGNYWEYDWLLEGDIMQVVAGVGSTQKQPRFLTAYTTYGLGQFLLKFFPYEFAMNLAVLIHIFTFTFLAVLMAYLFNRNFLSRSKSVIGSLFLLVMVKTSFDYFTYESTNFFIFALVFFLLSKNIKNEFPVIALTIFIGTMVKETAIFISVLYYMATRKFAKSVFLFMLSLSTHIIVAEVIFDIVPTDKPFMLMDYFKPIQIPFIILYILILGYSYLNIHKRDLMLKKMIYFPVLFIIPHIFYGGMTHTRLFLPMMIWSFPLIIANMFEETPYLVQIKDSLIEVPKELLAQFIALIKGIRI